MPGEQTGLDKAAAAAVEGRPSPEERAAGRGEVPASDTPAAGPHADPALVNPDATPGTGALPDPGEDEGTTASSG